MSNGQDLPSLIASEIRGGKKAAIVIGNGVSVDAGGRLTADIKQRLFADGRRDDGLREGVVTWLEQGSTTLTETPAAARLNMHSLERICLAVEKNSRFGRTGMVERLEGAILCDRLLVSGLAHDAIAHLMRQGRIAFTIDYNFDELLVDAMSVEFGSTAFDVVLGDLDCARFLKNMRSGSTLSPTIIKPHGSLSNPASILVTEQSVEQYGDRTRETLRTVIESVSILVMIGYSGHDPDFNDFLAGLAAARNSLRDTWVVWVDANPEQASIKTAVALLEQAGARCDAMANTASAFIAALGDCSAEVCHIPRLAPHIIRSSVVPSVMEERIPEVLYTVELLMQAARARGVFDIVAIHANPRLRAYRKRLDAQRNNTSSTEIVRSLIDHDVISPVPHDTRRYVCDPGRVAQQLMASIGPWLEGQPDGDLDSLFEQLSRDEDVEIIFDEDQAIPLQFAGAKPIRNMREFRERTDHVLNGSSPIRVTTTRGEWLKREDRAATLDGKDVNILLLEDLSHLHGIDAARSYVAAAQETMAALRARGWYVIEGFDAAEYHVTANASGEAVVFSRRDRSPALSPYYVNSRSGRAAVLASLDQAWARANSSADDR